MRTLLILLALGGLAAAQPAPRPARPTFELFDFSGPATRATRDGRGVRFTDPATGAVWQGRLGDLILRIDNKPVNVPLRDIGPGRQIGATVQFRLRAPESRPNAELFLMLEPLPTGAIRFTFTADDLPELERVAMLEDVFTVTGNGYVLLPTRQGLLIPANSGKAFTQGFDTYAYEGCHMAMFGVVQGDATVLVTWDDPYTEAVVRSAVPEDASKQTVTITPRLRKSAKSFTVHFPGKGDYNTIALAYREIAKQKGLLVTWDQKLKDRPQAAKLFGATNFKLWSTLSRSMNDESTKEERVTVNWTFDQAGQIAEHLKKDLELDDVFFLMGGWIRRGYDNQHPDILPSAPECGGDEAFAKACAKIRAQGYLLGLHDNYQDMYKDAPSWDEKYLNRNSDGTVTKGGKWAGGRAYITCSKMAVELAKRPQNLPAVKKLTNADAYFIDTTYAAGLMECFSKDHPLTRADDLKWKQAISDYGREVFGLFGSECGREWAIPHSDFFEGLTGVSGGYYHNKDLLAKVGGTVVPLFELVYRDTIQMYGKYGYSQGTAAEYVLSHALIGRPLHYHSVPKGLYWKDTAQGRIEATPSIANLEQLTPQKCKLTYRWTLAKPLPEDYRVFVHFTDAADKIAFQGDHDPVTTQWKVGATDVGPFTVNIPRDLKGDFAVRIGLLKPDGGRVALAGADQQQRVTLGTLRVDGARIALLPTAPEAPGADKGLYSRVEGGWAAGLHPHDRFLKNTHEILSPLNKLTSNRQMTRHEFLSASRKVQKTAFGDCTVLVNFDTQPYATKAALIGDVTLPPYGLLIESPTYVALVTTRCGDLKYDNAALYTLQSTDGKPIKDSAAVRVFHGFGDPRIKINGVERKIEKQAVVSFTK